MADGIESDGRSADTALTLDEAGLDPEASADGTRRVSQVWISSDNLRRILKAQGIPSTNQRKELWAALVYQLNTIVLYWQMGLFLDRLKHHTAPSETISLYILLFPGEAKDNTGIKDLNDKVIGQWWNAEFIRRRFDAIKGIFDTGSDFMVAAQTYKTAYILTYEGTRKDFVAKLAELDKQLVVILLQILDAAEGDATPEQRAEIKNLRKKLKKKNYRFDIFFGLRKLKPSGMSFFGLLKPSGTSRLGNVYLLVTEALKGAAIARYIAKTNSLGSGVKKIVTQIAPDAKKLDRRGKEYDWPVYMKASDMAEAIKALFVKGYTQSNPYVLNDVYVDTVWTLAFMQYKNLYWGNPDVVRDVRKKKLKPPPVKAGMLRGLQVAYSYPLNKNLLELWLVVLNMLDFVKRFKFDEFGNLLLAYHNDVLDVFTQVSESSKDINWAKLERVLTHDVRQKSPIAVFESASEFLFYSFAADHSQRIFFTMDVRDLGVELMLDYEYSNRVVGHEKYSDTDLMDETFRASDAIDERRRFTYDRIVEIFKKYYDMIAKGSGAAFTAAERAFGGASPDKLGSFTESVQIMLGGDEIYAAVHPLFAQYLPNIASDLDKTAYGDDWTINVRLSVAFSSAEKADPAEQRRENQLSHQDAMRLAEEAPATLKQLERTERRVERLIDMLEANPKKKGKGPGYRKELDKLLLTKLFARVKHGKPRRLTLDEFRRLLDALKRGDIVAALRTKKFDLVDFNGQVVDGSKLEKDAAALEDRVRRDVGFDNVRGHPPPVKNPKRWFDLLRPKLPK